MVNPVKFTVCQQPAQAMQIRLTAPLLEALRAAASMGQSASIRFGAVQQIVVGDIVFPFASFNQDATCDLMHLLAGGAGAAIVASVRRKLVVQRTVNDAERGRLRARAEEAEREKHERVAQVLGDCEARGKKSGARATTVRRVTPQPECQAVQKQQQQQQRVQPPAVAVLSASARPPSHVACPAGRVAPAAAGSAGAAPSPPAKPVHKSTSTPALKASSCGAGAASALAATPLRASDAAVAAARGGGLRALLLALLAERGAKGVSPNALRSLVKDVGLRVRAFRVPPFDELQREAKRLAEHVSPGIYVLHAWLHPEAEAALADAQTRAGGGGGGGRRRSVTPSHTLGGAGVQQASEGSPPNTTRGPGPGATGAKRRAESSPEGEAVEARRKRAASAPPAQQQVSGGSSGRARACSSGSRGSHDADDSWVVEHASRMPLPAPRISSREEYEAQAAAYNRGYESYFRLHQLIEANKRDFQALLSARALAATLEQRAAAEADLAALARKRGPRAERWEAAFRVLHAELAAIKASLAAFVTSCRAAAFANGSASCAAQAQAQARRAAADLAVGPDVEEI